MSLNGDGHTDLCSIHASIHSYASGSKSSRNLFANSASRRIRTGRSLIPNTHTPWRHFPRHICLPSIQVACTANQGLPSGIPWINKINWVMIHSRAAGELIRHSRTGKVYRYMFNVTFAWLFLFEMRSWWLDESILSSTTSDWDHVRPVFTDKLQFHTSNCGVIFQCSSMSLLKFIACTVADWVGFILLWELIV